MEETRIKMVGDPSWAKENLVSGMLRLVREDGLFASFGGINAMLVKQVPYTMGKQVSFDLIAKALYNLCEYLSQTQSDFYIKYSIEEKKWMISIMSAFLASVLASLSSQPGDMILTKTYKGSKKDATVGSKKKSGVFGIIGDIYREHGVGGFFLGTKARLAHVVAIITMQLTLYDALKAALGLPVTGSH
jgi:solute carrier family 25 phosphate transporter 3